jgi:ketosteroid isomerase-like protein
MATALDQSERESIMSALGRLADDIKRAYATNDGDLYLSAFDDDAIVSMPGAPPARGHAALRALFENRPPLPPGATFTVEPLEIDPLSADWAYAYGTDTIALSDDSKQTMTFLVLIRKTADGWKTFREVLSADQ